MARLDQIARVVAATWPGAEEAQTDAFTCRRGLNGGRRASGATPKRAVTTDDLPEAIRIMQGWGQTPMIAVREDQLDLAALLDAEGWRDHDHSTYFVGPISAMTTEKPPRTSTFAIWEPLAIMVDLWAANEIPGPRIDVMRRATCPKTTILGRTENRPAGCVYVGAHESMAMIHSLVIAPEFRRKGLAGHMMRAAAHWAADQGCSQMALLVGRDNKPAHALYTSLGMAPVGSYHYRSLEPS